MVGFKLGQDENGDFSENRSLTVLQKYASEIGLDKKTGIELTESSPQVSNAYAVPSYIGQGTNAYTTSQLARYATTIATSGTVYDLTLLDRQTDSKGSVLKEYEPNVINTMDVSQNVWDDIHDGMYRVVQTHKQFDGLGVQVAGKTGTAEVDGVYHPNHGMFIGYAPATDPQYAIAVRIENGYSSGNACLAAVIFSNIFSSWQMNRRFLQVLLPVIPAIHRMIKIQWNQKYIGRIPEVWKLSFRRNRNYE